jgi:hypothetical protein
MNAFCRKAWTAALAAVSLFALVGQSRAEMTCAEMTARLGQLSEKGSAPLRPSANGPAFKSLYDDCDAADRFESRALPSHAGRRLKCSTDKNRVAFVNKYEAGPVVWKAKMAVDADGSPVSMGPHASSTDQPVTWLTFDAGSDRRFVNAEDLSFVVVPTQAPSGTSFQAAAGVGKGDLAAIFSGGRCSFGVVGDAGPYFRFGEASLKTHEDLGNPQCATTGEHPCKKLVAGGGGRGLASGVTYIVFPGSRPKPLINQTAAAVSTKAAKAAAERFLQDHSPP